MDKTVYISLLFDFYGELLTEKQKEYVDLYFNDNLSLSEIAENDGISRQGVRDILVRAEATLTETEKKTGLVARHTQLCRQVEEAEALLDEVAQLNADRFKNPTLLSLCNRLHDKLQEMKL